MRDRPMGGSFGPHRTRNQQRARSPRLRLNRDDESSQQGAATSGLVHDLADRSRARTKRVRVRATLHRAALSTGPGLGGSGSELRCIARL